MPPLSRRRLPAPRSHEIVGFVTEVGPEVTRFKVGNRVGVGCMVNSCRDCGACKQGEEQYCSAGLVSRRGRRGRLVLLVLGLCWMGS